MKEAYTIKELESVLGISRQAIQKKARKENWPFHPRTGRGGVELAGRFENQGGIMKITSCNPLERMKGKACKKFRALKHALGYAPSQAVSLCSLPVHLLSTLRSLSSRFPLKFRPSQGVRSGSIEILSSKRQILEVWPPSCPSKPMKVYFSCDDPSVVEIAGEVVSSQDFLTFFPPLRVSPKSKELLDELEHAIDKPKSM